MTAARLFATLALGFVSLGCVPATHVLVLRPDGVLHPGATNTVVAVAVPGDWHTIYPVVPGRDVAGYEGPDNFTSMAVLVRRAGIDSRDCPEVAHQAASFAVEAAVLMSNAITTTSRPVLFEQYLWATRDPGQPDLTKARPTFTSSPEAPEVVDYRIERLTPGNFAPGTHDRFVFGRAMCRKGTLVVVSCSSGVSRRETMGPVCERIIGSLMIGDEPSGRGEERPVFAVRRVSQRQ